MEQISNIYKQIIQTMKKHIIFVILMLLATTSHAQEFEYEKAPGFIKSKYNNCTQEKKLDAKVHINCEIAIGENNIYISLSPIHGNKSEETAEYKSQSFLEIKADKDSGHDKYFKIYSIMQPNYSIEYTTYSKSDKLSIIYNGETYCINCIDEDKNAHIKNLSHQYEQLLYGEIFTLKVTNDIQLESKEKKSLILKSGSRFTFFIKEAV